MSECVAITETGTLAPTGEDTSACSGYVLLSLSDYQNLQHSGVLPPLSVADGTEIGMAMAGVFVTAWIWGAIYRALNP
jgi:hypothetical protein